MGLEVADTSLSLPLLTDTNDVAEISDDATLTLIAFDAVVDTVDTRIAHACILFIPTPVTETVLDVALALKITLV